MVDAEVIVIGSCNTDFVSYVERLPNPGETIHGHGFSTSCGGKGTNQSVAAAKLGAATAMIAKVGNDTFGQKFCEIFQGLGIDSSYVKCIDEAPTGAATILVDNKGENAIVVVAGANLFMTEEDVLNAENMIKKSKVVVCQGEISENATVKALAVACKHNVMTIMNAAPADSKMNAEIFKLAHIFCVNETEAKILTNVSVSSIHDALTASRILIDKGCTIVIITLGSKGAVFCNSETNFHIASPKVETVIDTTGAGDAFVGALAYFISQSSDLDWKNLIRKACQVAAYSVQIKGSQSSFPYLSDVSDLI